VEKGGVREDVGVAVHACLGRRNACECRLLDRRVAVAAVDAVTADVALVAELNRLLPRNLRAGNPRRSRDRGGEEQQPDDDEERPEETDPRKRVRARVKDLRHRTTAGGAMRSTVEELRVEA